MNYSGDHSSNFKPITEQSTSQQADSDSEFMPFPLVLKPPLFTPKILQEVWGLSEPPKLIDAYHWSTFGGSRVKERARVDICWVNKAEDKEKLYQWLGVWFMLTACTVSFDGKPELEGIRGKEVVSNYGHNVNKLIRIREAEVKKCKHFEFP